jgi:hypothetical protein
MTGVLHIVDDNLVFPVQGLGMYLDHLANAALLCCLLIQINDWFWPGTEGAPLAFKCMAAWLKLDPSGGGRTLLSPAEFAESQVDPM